MSSIVIEDIGETTVLDKTAMAGIVGGMDVRVDSVSSTLRSTDDNSGLAPDLLGALVNIVIDGIHQQQSQKNRPH